jgi:two-component system, NtrC family, nitrogen regulation response regulator GlnG
VSAFTDPTIALESLNSNDDGCNLIISDIRMPGMNGYELIRKAKEIKKQLKVVLMTAFDIDDRVSRPALRYQSRWIYSETIFNDEIK